MEKQFEQAEKRLIRGHFEQAYGQCDGMLKAGPRTIDDAGSDARIDGVRQYTVQTFRHPHGVYHFLTIVEGDHVKRVCLPPAVADLMQAQRDSVAARARRAHGRAAAKNLPRPPKGVVPKQFRKRK
jgi:hypothetical protein